MSAPRRGLGRGLDSLLPDSEPKREVALSEIKAPASQPRERFVEVDLMKLAASIRQHGVLQPLVVAEEGRQFRLIAGERRLRAAKLAGLNHVPVFIRSDETQRHFELALVENLQRRDLSPIEEAKAYDRLLAESPVTQEDLAKRLGVGRAKVALALRLLKLPVGARRALEEGRISGGHAQAILSAPAERRDQVLSSIIERKLSVRAAEQLAGGRSPRAKPAQPDWAAQLGRKLGAKVRVRGTAKRGTLSLTYYSTEELEELIRRLERD